MREEGRKYESGRVETEFSRLEDIEGCAIVPVYYKLEHDTIPMLCVEIQDGAGEPMDVVLEALRRVFIEEKTLPEDDIPSRVMLTEKLPRNTNGKIDLYRLNQGQVSGDVYAVDPVHEEDQLSDFSLTPREDATGDVFDQVIDSITAEIKNGSHGNNPMLDIEKMLNLASSMPSEPTVPPIPPAPPAPPVAPMPFMPMPGRAALGWPGRTPPRNSRRISDPAWKRFGSSSAIFRGRP